MLDALDGVCKGIVLIGKAAPLIRAAAAQHGATYPMIDATDMHDAVRRATELCAAGDAVVLSPASASYDMFQNFGHRGRVFREAVSAVGAKRLDVCAATRTRATTARRRCSGSRNRRASS